MTEPKRGRPPGTPQPPGTGRKPKPPGEKFKRIHITVSPALYDRLTQAQGEGQTMTSVITAILEDQLPE